ncbi:MAG: hypothetical protein SF339_12490 [Blastocatellia bacterium]|nr:hypothetical protein [Blastocatellia bacterium]
MNRSIVVILPRGETYRNFIYTGVLRELSAQAEVTLLSVYPNEEFREKMAAEVGRALPLQEHRDRWVPRFLREILDMAHGRWLWSGAARERWRLRDAEANTPMKWLKRRGRKLLSYPFANPTGLRLLSKAERTASRWLRTSDEYLAMFREQRPSLVFNGSHAHSVNAIQAVQAAQWLGIPTATFIFSWDNLTSQGRIILPYDYYLVWNEHLRKQLLEIYPQIRPENVFVTGTPQFDAHFQPRHHWSREEFCERIGADPARPIVFYSTGMANHVPGEPRIVEGIAAMLCEIPVPIRPQLLVRVSPKDLTGRFEQMKRDLPEILFPEVPWDARWLTPKPEDAWLLANSIRHAAVGINVGSTISLELCMFDKPVINVGYNPPGIDIHPVDIPRYYFFDHYRPIVESGAVRLAGSEEEMRSLLIEALTTPEAAAAQRKRLIQSMFDDTLDGNSGRRVVECLLKLS